MIRKFLSIFEGLLLNATKSVYSRIIFIAFFISPVIFLAVFNYNRLYKDSTMVVTTQKKSLAVLSATIVDERLDSMVNLGISFATRPKLIDDIKKEDWKGATDVLNGVIANFPFIERIFLTDLDGVIMSDMPAIPGTIGTDRADKEWYKTVTKTMRPYVSNVYQRVAEPRYNVVAVAVPIRVDPSLGFDVIARDNYKQSVLGILVTQIKLEEFSDWFQGLDTGPGGLIYVVDRAGCIVYHPKLNSQEEIKDFSSVPVVKELMKGLSGTEMNYNPIEKEERIAAYEPVSEYGWGVVVTQPAKMAFVSRNKELMNISFIYLVIIMFGFSLGYLISYVFAVRKRSEEELRELSITDHLTGLYNRRGFMLLAVQQFKLARRSKEDLGLVFIDLDNMKWINDTMGHAEGDAALAELAGILKMSFRESDIIGRMGGDEFAVLAIQAHKDAGKAVMARLNKNLDNRNKSAVPHYVLSISSGVAYCDINHPCTTEELLGRADKAMYEQKRAKKLSD